MCLDIDHTFSGPGVAQQTKECTINLPQSTDPLCSMLQTLRVHFSHNFMPCVLILASSVMAFHYQTFFAESSSCVLYHMLSVSLLPAKQLLSCVGCPCSGAKNISTAKCQKRKLSISVRLPIHQLLSTLYNGAHNATFAHGRLKPSTCCIIAANFIPTDQQRYDAFSINVEIKVTLGMSYLCLLFRMTEWLLFYTHM